MNDKIKFFLYGWLMGVKQLEREKAPVEKPVQFINIGYDKDKMKVGEKQILTATLYPPDATYQAVEWQSSDIDVLAVNKLTDTSAEISALKTGDAQIVCRATDTFGAKAVVTFHVQGNLVFTSFTFDKMTRSILNPRVAASMICVDYEPKTMKGTDWGIVLHNSVSGEDSPYIVEDSIFDNCKLIKPDYVSNNFDDYISHKVTGAAGDKMLYDIKTRDGSGIQILDKSMTDVSKSEFTRALYGYTGSPTNKNITMLTGYEFQIYDNNTTQFKQAIDLGDINVEIQQEDEIISVSNFTITALKAGTAKILVTFPYNVDNFEVNVTVVDSSTSTSRPTLCLVDNSGAVVEGLYNGALRTAENNYRVAFYCSDKSVGGKVISVKSRDTNGLLVNSDMTLTVLKPGSWVYDVTYEYGGTHAHYTTSQRIQILGDSLTIHKVESPYLRDGICLCVVTGGVYYADDYNMQSVVSVFNSNQVELEKKFKIASNLLITGCTYTPSLSTHAGTAIYYKFKKLTAGNATVSFQIEGFTETKKSITI